MHGRFSPGLAASRASPSMPAAPKAWAGTAQYLMGRTHTPGMDDGRGGKRTPDVTNPAPMTQPELRRVEAKYMGFVDQALRETARRLRDAVGEEEWAALELSMAGVARAGAALGAVLAALGHGGEGDGECFPPLVLSSISGRQYSPPEEQFWMSEVARAELLRVLRRALAYNVPAAVPVASLNEALTKRTLMRFGFDWIKIGFGQARRLL